MRHLEVGGHEAAVHVEQPAVQTATDVMLVHGAGFDHTAWRYQTRFLAGRGHRVLAPDLPGHGRSAGPPLGSIAEMADWLGRVTESLECRSPVLMGHSMGTFVALHRATSVPESTRGLVLVAATDRMRVHPELLEAAAAGDHHAIDLMIGWMHTGEKQYGGHKGAGSWSAGSSRRTIEQNLRSLGTDLAVCEGYDPTERAPAVDHPTLIISSSADKMTPSSGAGRMSELIAGSEHRVISGGGHMALFEQSEEVNGIIVEFLARLAVAAS